MMKKTWNLAVVEPNFIVRAGLARIFARTAFKECIECATIDQLWKLAEKDNIIDLFLIDIGKDISPFKEGINTIKTRFPESFIVIMADSVDESTIAQAMHVGVHGFIPRGMRIEAIVKSLELILLGEPVFPPAPSKHSPLDGYVFPKQDGHTNHADAIAFDLSSREIEVLMSLALGKSNKEIARDLDISDATVKVHVKAILRKLRMKNRTEAALWATGVGLLNTSAHQH